jgi:hypothetical protein
MQNNKSDCDGKYIGSQLKNTPGAESRLRPKPETSVLQNLLAASKDAEVLIACLAEQHLFTAAPLHEIWENLAAAIDEAQASLRAKHPDVHSAQSSRGYRERRP